VSTRSPGRRVRGGGGGWLGRKPDLAYTGTPLLNVGWRLKSRMQVLPRREGQRDENEVVELEDDELGFLVIAVYPDDG
jgi:hypothetical protein